MVTGPCSEMAQNTDEMVWQLSAVRISPFLMLFVIASQMPEVTRLATVSSWFLESSTSYTRIMFTLAAPFG
jgi:hypothetical protein